MNKWIRKIKMLVAKDVIDEIKRAAALVIDGYATKLVTAGMTAQEKTQLAGTHVKAAALAMANAQQEAAAAKAFADAVALLAPSK